VLRTSPAISSLSQKSWGKGFDMLQLMTCRVRIREVPRETRPSRLLDMRTLYQEGETIDTGGLKMERRWIGLDRMNAPSEVLKFFIVRR
jgi:hypothetical protein